MQNQELAKLDQLIASYEKNESAPTEMFPPGPFLQIKLALRFIKLGFGLFATGASPVFREAFESHTIVLRRVINVATDAAHVLAGGFFLFENNFGPDGGNRVVKVHYTLGLQILVALRGVGELNFSYLCTRIIKTSHV